MKLLLKSVLGLCLIGSNCIPDAYANECEKSCQSRCYECACNPLYCGAYDLQIQAGVAPITWRNRAELANVNCAFAAPYIPLLDIPAYNKFFKIPWVVGGQIGYAFSDHHRVYAEINYIQGNGKSAATFVTTNPIIAPAETLVFDMNKYKEITGHVGARYYWNRWCQSACLFLGAKVGFTHHQKVNFTLNLTAPLTIALIPNSTPFFYSNTVLSGGVNFGLDICCCGNWSFVITGEVVASGGPKSNSNVVLTPTGGSTATNFLVGIIQNELRFPVTAAVRYSF